MLTTNDMAKIYETVLTIPGMNEGVKIDLKITRKNVLLLNNVIKRGLNMKDDDKSGSLVSSLPEETIKELMAVADLCLTKAGLTELSEKLGSFTNSK